MLNNRIRSGDRSLKDGYRFKYARVERQHFDSQWSTSVSSRRRKVEETILTSTCNWQYSLIGVYDVVVNGKIAVNRRSEKL